MSPGERAAEQVRRLAQEVGAELDRVHAVVVELERLAGELVPGCSRDTRMSAAGHIHAFYTGCEAALLRIAREFAEAPESERWHRSLLAQAVAPREGVRPPIISPATFADLLEFLRFRHFFRVSYGVELVPEKLREQASAAVPTFGRFRGEVEAFLRLLESAAQA